MTAFYTIEFGIKSCEESWPPLLIHKGKILRQQAKQLRLPPDALNLQGLPHPGHSIMDRKNLKASIFPFM